MEFKIHTLLVVILFFFAPPSQTNGQASRSDSWPMINGSPARSSQVTMELSFPLEVAYDVSLVEGSQRAIKNGILVTTAASNPVSSPNTVIASDIVTGETLWSRSITGSRGSSGFYPAIVGDVTIASGQQADGIWGLDLLTGDSLWFIPTIGSTFGRAPVIYDDLAYVPVSNVLFCLDPANGDTVWYHNGNIRQMSPAVNDSLVFFKEGTTIMAFDRLTGDTVWTSPSIDGTGGLALDSQRVYNSDFRSGVRAFDIHDGELQWAFEFDTAVSEIERLLGYPNDIALSDEYVIAKYWKVDLDTTWYLVFDKESGEELNTFRGGIRAWSTPVIINDLMADYADSRLVFWSLPEGDTVYTTETLNPGGTDQIMVIGDSIFIAGDNGFVTVLTSAETSSTEEPSMDVSLRIAPNPVGHELTVTFESATAGVAEVEIYGMDGKSTGVSIKRQLFGGLESIAIPVDKLDNGIYVLSLTVDGRRVAQKFMKY